jgi:NitT/TauT family transport system ATP-binding protein
MEDKNLVNHISIENVSFRYDDQQVIKNLNLKVNKGEIVVIIGPSGCGKTSLLSLLNGYLSPQSGAVQMNGLIRTVHQHGSLFPWLTVNENIGIGLRHLKNQGAQQKGIEDMLKLINMEGFENHYPHELSGGMKQRVELGRVLAGDADIILMDEPFSSLDYQARLKMRRELIDLLAKRPRTVIMVTHDIEEAVQIADRILVLTKRPSMVCAELDVTVAHPRQSSDPDLIKIADNVLLELGL